MSTSCVSCNQRPSCCITSTSIPAQPQRQFNGSLGTGLRSYQHCFEQNFIKTLNATINRTDLYAEYGLYKVKNNRLQLNFSTNIGELSLHADPIELQTYSLPASPGKSNKSDSYKYGSGKLLIFVSFFIMLINGCVC